MTKEELRKLIATALNIDPSQLQDDSGSGTIVEWDSMGALGIISAIDEATGGDISAEDAEKFKSFAAILAFARKKGIVKD